MRTILVLGMLVVGWISSPVESFAADESSASGIYVGTIGQSGTAFHRKMTLELKADQTADYTSVSELKNQKSEKTLSGKWAIEGDAIVATFEKISDGTPVPEHLKSVRFLKKSGDEIFDERNPTTILKRTPVKG